VSNRALLDSFRPVLLRVSFQTTVAGRCLRFREDRAVWKRLQHLSIFSAIFDAAKTRGTSFSETAVIAQNHPNLISYAIANALVNPRHHPIVYPDLL
jgi:hypothetical protein